MADITLDKQMSTKRVTIPTKLEELTVRQLTSYLSNAPTDPKKAVERALRLWSGVTPEEFESMKLDDYYEVSEAILGVLNEMPESPENFTHNGVTYGRIPNFADMTAGEFVDLSTYLKDSSNLHKALSVAYRPVVKQKGKLYEIEPYEGSDKLSGVMQEVPASVGVGLTVFFYALAKDLAIVGLMSSQERAERVRALRLMQELPSHRDGDGIPTSTSLQGGTLSSCLQLLNSPLENFSQP